MITTPPGQGAAAERTTEWVDLSQPVFPGMPAAKPHGELKLWVDHPSLSADATVRITHFEMAAHMGTHIDAPAHFIPDGRRIAEFDTAQFTGPGVVLNLRREGVVAIDVADLEGAPVPIRRGDIVLIYTGHAEKFGVEDLHTTGHPYLTVDAAWWLVRHEVPVVGMDVFTPDMPDGFRPPNFTWPVHQVLLGNETLVIENLGTGLTNLLDRRVEVVCVPMRLHDADAGPVVPLARPTYEDTHPRR